MISLSKVKSSLLSKGLRILKVFEFGAKTGNECMPFGEDSNPLKEMTAVLVNTKDKGTPIIIGYINRNQISQIGEKRIYSLKTDGSLSSYIWLKNNETIELGGNADNLVRFNSLKSGIDTKDDLINQELAKISLAISSVGGAYTPASISTNIDASKIENIKSS